jgi:ABC-type transport system involved in cytochrome c biogenesis permease subunit
MRVLLKSSLALLLFFLPLFGLQSQNPEKDFTVLYKGRFRPSEAYARLWLYDLYHHQSIKTSDLSSFHIGDHSALKFLLGLHVFGSSTWKTAPLFWIKSAELKKLAGLELKRERFSFQELDHAFYGNEETSQIIFNYLATYEYLQSYLNPFNYTLSERFEMKNLLPGLWVQFNRSDLIITSVPEKKKYWPFLTSGKVISKQVRENAPQLLREKKQVSEELLTLFANMRRFELLSGPILHLDEAFETSFKDLYKQNLPPTKIAAALEKEYPLLSRLNAAGSLFQALPSKNQEDWFSFHAFKVKVYSSQENRLVPINNFTIFPDEIFEDIRQKYLEWEKSVLKHTDSDSSNQLFYDFSAALTKAYQQIAGTPYKLAEGKALKYPSSLQLHIESLYYQYPWIEILIFLYTISAACIFFAYRMNNPLLHRLALGSLGFTFLLHTLLLVCRSYILSRPPVSNMFETVIYVPWVTTACGLLLNSVRKHTLILMAACISSISLLMILKLTDLNNSFDNVQAVLDSQFWLMIHVLMIVGSYGIFILGAVVAHIYLLIYLLTPNETATMRTLTHFIQQTLYLGLVLLIPGTLLGGVWAAESWGRFWDWDPKESWAFISICLYLVLVHAYRYHRIGSFGLAIGSVGGLLVISFTWYGVNYILGTGLHSYGFGSGGEIYYYAFMLLELTFSIFMLCIYKSRNRIMPHNQKYSR